MTQKKIENQALFSEERAYTYALNSLLSRPQSVSEIREKLKSRTAFENIEPIIERLVNYGYLNDQALVESWLQSAKMQGRGLRWVQLRARKRGVPLSSAQVLLLDEQMSEGEDFSKISDLVNRKYPAWKSDRKEKFKAMGFLVRRGYSIKRIEAIFKVSVEKATLEPDFDSSLEF